jgi:hypothetical protein
MHFIIQSSIKKFKFVVGSNIFHNKGHISWIIEKSFWFFFGDYALDLMFKHH